MFALTFGLTDCWLTQDRSDGFGHGTLSGHLFRDYDGVEENRQKPL